MIYSITVPGRPVPKGRPRTTLRGRKVIVYTPAETVQYEQIVGMCGKNVVKGNMLKGPLEVHIKLYFNPQAKKMTKAGKWRKHTNVPDVDNCIKSILDGLNKIAFQDDDQVKRIYAERFEDTNERAEIVIKEL